MKDQHPLKHSKSVTNTWSVERVTEASATLYVTQLHDDYADFVWRSLQRLGVGASNLADALQDSPLLLLPMVILAFARWPIRWNRSVP